MDKFNDVVIYGMNLLIIATITDKYVNNYCMTWAILVISYCILQTDNLFTYCNVLKKSAHLSNRSIGK